MYPSTRVLVGTMLLVGSTAPQAATLLVTTTVDSYGGRCVPWHCSLRDAVTAANRSGVSNIILLPPGTYGLSRLEPLGEDGLPIDEDDNLLGDLDVKGELLIKGSGSEKTIIDGLGTDLFVERHRLLEVRPGARLELEQLTLTRGNCVYNGGAVENHGRLLLRSLRVDRNRIRDDRDVPSTGSGRGGALANYGEAVVLDTHFERNDSNVFGDVSYGGAIYNLGSLKVRDSRFIRNSVGGFSLLGAGAALYNRGFADVGGSLIADSISADHSEEGAIANNGGTLILTNSTLSGTRGGTLTNGRLDDAKTRSSATLVNVSIVNNRNHYSEEHAVKNWGDLLVRNSIIAGNYDELTLEPETTVNCFNFGDAYSYQAIGLLRNDEKSNCSADLFVSGPETFTRVLSPELIAHGRTKTHDLLPGSPAVDAGVADCISRDQRGATRPQDGNGDGVAVCDLGAYELIP